MGKLEILHKIRYVLSSCEKKESRWTVVVVTVGHCALLELHNILYKYIHVVSSIGA